jgi:hypothetical protein
MSEPHIVSTLRTKRAEISGYIRDAEKKIKRMRANLAHVDATIRLFAPGLDPDTIPAKRTYRRTRYFAKGELSRRCLDILRDAQGPLATAEIAAAIMADKGSLANDPALVAAIAERVQGLLRNLRKREAVIKTGTSRDALWALGRLP